MNEYSLAKVQYIYIIKGLQRYEKISKIPKFEGRMQKICLYNGDSKIEIFCQIGICFASASIRIL